MRKVIIACVLAGASSIALADNAPGIGYYVYSSTATGTYQANTNDFHGPYLGLSFNINPQQVKFSQLSLSTNATKTDMNGGLFGGYGWTVGKVYFGLEANGRYNFSGNTHNTSVGSATFLNAKETWSAGVSGLFGGVIADNALLYLIGGAQYGHFKYSADSASQSTSKGKIAWRFGVGTNLQLSDHWNFDLRYQIEHYSSIAPSAFSKIQVTNNMVTMGLSYHFA